VIYTGSDHFDLLPGFDKPAAENLGIVPD